MTPPATGRSIVAPRTLRGVVAHPAFYSGLIPAVTLLNALTGLALPRLMPPQVFGEYSLVVTLFQYGLIFDLGVSQLMDRWIPARIGQGRRAEAERIGDELLWLRLYIAVAAAAAALAVLWLLSALGRLPFPLTVGALSVLAGLLYMVALGPACVYRARSARGFYTVSVSVLSFGLVVARLGGIMAAGAFGCFVALSLWYGAFACLFHWHMPPAGAARPGWRLSFRLVGQGIPFSASSFVWAFYLTANRWFASMLIAPESFGEFAFGTNIFALLVGAAGGFSALYYPHISERFAREGRYALSAKLGKDLLRLVAASAVVVGCGIVLAGPLVGLLYPLYTGGLPGVRLLLVPVPALVLASWLMPISLSAGRRPWVDGAVVYPVATAVLGSATVILFHAAGVSGAALASTVSALPLVAMQLLLLCRSHVLRAPCAARLLGVTIAVTLLLGSLTWLPLP